ncbi:CLUMA_CG006976, isoform A [Clunio marinus]|uniref:CLUMA_CG006976, isoform A n=1 Tax=Clunio marinus TaxID=568069 RepID=A0A1J1HZB0_9DIPT|nr:CLUMA_CG006976, isoform A [Clunio marinus]
MRKTFLRCKKKRLDSIRQSLAGSSHDQTPQKTEIECNLEKFCGGKCSCSGAFTGFRREVRSEKRKARFEAEDS